MSVTDEQRAGQIRALIAERAGYVRYGRTDRAALVDVELKRLGAEGAAPARRATKLMKKAGQPKASAKGGV